MVDAEYTVPGKTGTPPRGDDYARARVPIALVRRNLGKGVADLSRIGRRRGARTGTLRNEWCSLPETRIETTR